MDYADEQSLPHLYRIVETIWPSGQFPGIVTRKSAESLNIQKKTYKHIHFSQLLGIITLKIAVKKTLFREYLRENK